MNKIFRTSLYILSVLLVVAFAFGLRARAVNDLPIDYDEDDYLRAGQEYAHLIRTSNWSGFLETNYRAEHPPLAKIIIGLSVLSAPEEPLTPDAPTSAPPNKNLPEDLVKSARMGNAIFGVITVFILALINPLAGLMLALHTLTIKYVSQIMLEAVPALTSLGMALSYLQWKKSKRSGWLILSAIALGLTAASKYLYCVVGIAILVDWYLDSKEKDALKAYLRAAALWGILGVVIFFLFDPYLWTNPIARLGESIFYHSSYSSGAAEVARAGFPIWQPFSWLFFSPYWWHENVFPFPFDPFIALLALFGLKRLWKKERLYILWLGIALAFLLIWNTKWPQYIVILTLPLSLAAAEGLTLFKDNLLEWWRARKTRVKIHYDKAETRRALPWLIPGLIAFAALTLFPLLFQFAVSLISLNGDTLRDGFQGGIWREVWGGLTGQISPNYVEDGKVHFIGLLWYADVLNWVGAMGLPFFNTLWTLLSVTLQTALGVGAALLLWQRGIKFRKGWQALFILPWAIPEAIGAMLWLNIFAPVSGWLVLATNKFGTDMPFGFFKDWERSQNMSMLVLLIVALWYGFPFMMLAASAGLKLLPAEVFDAAAIDGASAWQTFRYVTLPLIAPLVVPAIIIRAIFAFNQFYLFQMFYFVDGNFNMFTFASMSYFMVYNRREITGSAIVNIVTIVFLLVFIVLFNRWSKAGEGVTYA
jgi:arabinogalactan oligomer/maltooligosaccharide transport system permease protein